MMTKQSNDKLGWDYGPEGHAPAEANSVATNPLGWDYGDVGHEVALSDLAPFETDTLCLSDLLTGLEASGSLDDLFKVADSDAGTQLAVKTGDGFEPVAFFSDVHCDTLDSLMGCGVITID